MSAELVRRVLLSSALAVCVLLGGACLADGWRFEHPQETGGVTGYYSAVQIDGTGAPCVAYAARGRLFYGRLEPSSFKYDQLDELGIELGDSPGWVSMALAGGVTPHIAFFERNHETLQYAWLDGGVWRYETIDQAGSVGFYNSMAIDGAGRPVVAYYDLTNGDLKVAVRTGGVWTTETVDSTYDVGRYCSLAVAPSGVLHVSYYDGSHGDLKHAWKDGGGWHTETVDSVGTVGQFSSLAVDGAGYAHIAYYTANGEDLIHAWQDSTGWHIETVDSAGETGFYPTMAIAPGPVGSQTPWVGYYDATNNTLRVAYKDGTGWHPTTVDSVGLVGLNTPVAMKLCRLHQLPHVHRQSTQAGQARGGALDNPPTRYRRPGGPSHEHRARCHRPAACHVLRPHRQQSGARMAYVRGLEDGGDRWSRSCWLGLLP